MNDPILNLNSPPAAAAALTAEEQALHDHFLALPIQKRLRLLRLLHHWEQAPPTRRAMAVKLLDAGLPTKVVAWLCEVTDRTLRRHRPYQDFARQLRQQGNPPPRGAKGRDGEIEAWDGKE